MQIDILNKVYTVRGWRAMCVIYMMCFAVPLSSNDVPQSLGAFLGQCGQHVDSMGRTTANAFLHTLDGMAAAYEKTPGPLIVGGSALIAHYYVRANYKYGWKGFWWNTLWPFGNGDGNNPATQGNIWKLERDIYELTQQVGHLQNIIKGVNENNKKRYDELNENLGTVQKNFDAKLEKMQNEINFQENQTRQTVREEKDKLQKDISKLDSKLSDVRYRELPDISGSIKDMDKKLFSEDDDSLKSDLWKVKENVGFLLSNTERNEQEISTIWEILNLSGAVQNINPQKLSNDSCNFLVKQMGRRSSRRNKQTGKLFLDQKQTGYHSITSQSQGFPLHDERSKK